MSAARDHDPEHIVELFAVFGPVSVRRMFSGAGIFAGGVMIGLISRGVIYLKADTATIPDFEKEGLDSFTYQTKTRQRALASYWRMPDQLYDAPDELAQWARRAHAAALHAGEVSARPQTKRRAKRPAVKRKKK